MSLNFAYNIWFIICGVLLIGAFSFWIYRTTTPEASHFFRRFLLALRIVVLVIILVLLFEPNLQLFFNRTSKPVVAVLIDDSASMLLQDGNLTRSERALHLSQELSTNSLLNEKSTLSFIAFADTAVAVEKNRLDSLKFNGDGTDLTFALEQTISLFRDENLAAVLLLSDGASNLGDDPSQMGDKIPAPVFPVILGNTTSPKDSWLKDIITNEIAFADTRIPVEIYVRSQGFAQQKSKVRIKQGHQVFAEQEIVLPGDGLEKQLVLYLTPEQQGKQKFIVELDTSKAEITDQNNSRSFYLNVLKSKLKVLLLAAAPSPDLAFIKQALQKNENFSLQQTIAINSKKITGDPLPKGQQLEEIDCIIGINLAIRSPHPDIEPWLKNAVMNHAKPLFFFAGPVEAAQNLWGYKDILFLAQRPQITKEKQIQVELSDSGILHPIFKIDDSANNLKSQVAELPPVFTNLHSIQFQPNATVLAYSAVGRALNKPGNQTGMPIISVGKLDNKRVIAVFGNSLWRWNLLMQRNDGKNVFYTNFIQNSVRWLASRDENKVLKVQPAGDIFRSGQQIEFGAQAYYDNYRVRENLQISLNITGAQSGDYLFTEKGNGLYKCVPGLLSAGDYSYVSQATDRGKVVSADSGKFSVIPFQWELQKTQANAEIARRLASSSGGKMISPDSLSNWIAGLQLAAEIKREKLEVKVWHHWIAFLMIIVFLSLEWLLRKQKGML
ncbi:MAG: VWA domain-containing protein [Calditrichaeota bacterium]|nr:MAG: VWA domain-containing protein [Calditrichota bacterium]